MRWFYTLLKQWNERYTLKIKKAHLIRISIHMTDGIRPPQYKLASMHLNVSGEANSPFFRRHVDKLAG